MNMRHSFGDPRGGKDPLLALLEAMQDHDREVTAALSDILKTLEVLRMRIARLERIETARQLALLQQRAEDAVVPRPG